MTREIDDLRALWGRGELSEAELRDYRRRCQGSAEARFMEVMAAEVRAEGRFRPGDQALMARVAARVMEGVRTEPEQPRKLSVLAYSGVVSGQLGYSEEVMTLMFVSER